MLLATHSPTPLALPLATTLTIPQIMGTTLIATLVPQSAPSAAPSSRSSSPACNRDCTPLTLHVALIVDPVVAVALHLHAAVAAAVLHGHTCMYIPNYSLDCMHTTVVTYSSPCIQSTSQPEPSHDRHTRHHPRTTALLQ